MTALTLAGFGLVTAAVEAVLVWKFGARANRTGIGSFTLLPLAGLAYLGGILGIVIGLLFVLLGLLAP